MLTSPRVELGVRCDSEVTPGDRAKPYLHLTLLNPSTTECVFHVL